MKTFRDESDCLGRMQVAADAYYGIQTLRAIKNFPMTRVSISHYPEFIKSFACLKKAAALANHELERLDDQRCQAICAACDDLLQGLFHDQFKVDVIQGGAGTSSNMNANEVIANIALEKLGRPLGEYEFLHPNNHVNLSQSTNDVYPTAIRLTLLKMSRKLMRALEALSRALAEKGIEFERVIKIGRTQLQDAVPITLGQEFHAWAVMVREDCQRLADSLELVREINLGGTAVGTGLNTPPHYSKTVLEHLNRISGEQMTASDNLVEATQDTGAYVQFSGVLKRTAVKISKICNDLRLLSSGPRCGLGEIRLPEMAPGSSIMPGKVNPVIPEVVNQIAFEVIGSDLTVTLAAQAGQLELNAMEPVLAHNLFSSLLLLRNGVIVLANKCIHGIQANVERCKAFVESSLGLATALAPLVGYEQAASISRHALTHGCSVLESAKHILNWPDEHLRDILDPQKMLGPVESLTDPVLRADLEKNMTA
jgi:aspartate ammonia-lyase